MPPTFPETVLETGSLILRPLSASDIPDVQAAASDALTQQWLPLANPYTLEHATDWCTKAAPAVREEGKGITFAVADKATDHLVGAISLGKVGWRSLSCEIGYWVAPWARGQGVAAAAARAVVAWVFDAQGFERVELKAATGNVASRNTALRAGFREEGVMRNAGVTHGGRVDLVLYSVIPADLPTRLQ
jgi:RimJ/RimL family protein N-acetyltransferase